MVPALLTLFTLTMIPLVFEIFPTNRKIRDAGAYYQIALQRKINYRLIVREPVHEQDIIVDDELVNMIKEHLN